MLRGAIRDARRRARTLAATVRRFGVSRVGLGLHYAISTPFRPRSDSEHLQATLGWICRAQDAVGGDGVSAVFDLQSGWDVAYPETSGYIIGTLLACEKHFADTAYLERAIRIGDWEIAIQAGNGGVLSRPGRPETRVFNTGQVILGWLSLFERIGDTRYLDAATRAGDYLIAVQEPDGTWHRDTYCGARTYHARTDWALLRLANLSGAERYAEAARKNLRWVLQQQRENGWFSNCGFNEDDPITHVIDYTLVGLLESALVEPAVFDRPPAALIRRSADAICEAALRPGVGGIVGMLPASFDIRWQGHLTSSCLTGNAQLAYTLLRLDGLSPNSRYVTASERLLEALKGTQLIDDAPSEVVGALPGSFPMHTGYLANGYPNWGAKFLADALLARIRSGMGFQVNA